MEPLQPFAINFVAATALLWAIIGFLSYEAVRSVEMPIPWRVYVILTAGPLVWGLSIYRGLQYLRTRALKRYDAPRCGRCGDCGDHGGHS